MATSHDPWQPVGTLIYYIVLSLVKTIGFKVHGGVPVAREYQQDPEPRWILCSSCGHSTVHIAHFWVEDGDTDWECDQCGAVRYE
jgi:hypothetical protein